MDWLEALAMVCLEVYILVESVPVFWQVKREPMFWLVKREPMVWLLRKVPMFWLERLQEMLVMVLMEMKNCYELVEFSF